MLQTGHDASALVRCVYAFKETRFHGHWPRNVLNENQLQNGDSDDHKVKYMSGLRGFQAIIQSSSDFSRSICIT